MKDKSMNWISFGLLIVKEILTCILSIIIQVLIFIFKFVCILVKNCFLMIRSAIISFLEDSSIGRFILKVARKLIEYICMIMMKLYKYLKKSFISRSILKEVTKLKKPINRLILKLYKDLKKYQINKKNLGLVLSAINKVLIFIFKLVKICILNPIKKCLIFIFKLVKICILNPIKKVLIFIFKPINIYIWNPIKKCYIKIRSLIIAVLEKTVVGRFILKIVRAIKKYIRRKINKLVNALNKLVKALKKLPNTLKKFICRKILELVKTLKKYQVKKKIWGFIFVIPWLIGFLLFFLKPFYESLIFSFHKVTPSAEGLKMTYVGIERYINALTVHVDFLRILLQSLGDIFINLWVILIFSLLMAVLLNTKFKGRTFARAVFFIPVIFNSAAIESALGGGEAVRTFMNQSGLGIMGIFDLKSYLLEANMAPWLINFLVSSIDRIYLIISYSGVQILIFLAGLQSIPFHLYEAAKIEGATQYEIFWKITLPMVSPLILTAAVYTIVNSFLRSPITEVMQTVYNAQDYGLYAAMSWMYFGVSAILLTVVLFFLSKVVFYYDK